LSKVAVLVPSYNDAPTVAATIRSIVGQSCSVITSVVLADDASRDDTVATARAAAGSDLELKIWRAQQNLGPWANLNRGLHELNHLCDWVLVLHADDLAVAGWVAALLARIEKCGDDVASISTSWDMLYGERVHETGERHADEWRLIPGSPQAVRDTLLKGCWWKISGAAIRLRAFLDIGDFDAAVPQCADWDWTMRALMRGWSFEYIPRVHTIYRQHAATMSSAALRNDVDIMDALTMFERFGHTLGKAEIVRYHARRGGYALRRLVRGVVQRDGQRVSVSLRTIATLSRQLVRRLAA
jgi:glycosyltransferase involved in cell wall biosynthesis